MKPIQKVLLFGLLAMALSFISAAQSGAAEPLARITDFNGDVIVLTDSKALKVENVDHPLVGGDRVQTKDGTAEITFEDGAIIKVSPFTSTQIQEKEEESGFWIFKTLEKVRRITCFVGKLKFKSGKKVHLNYLQTPTAVAGVRGSEAFLGHDGIKNYLTEVSGEFETIGEFVEGYFDNPGVDAATKSKVYNALESAAEAHEQAEKSGSETDQAKAELSGLEAVKAAAEELAGNPDQKVAEEAQQVLSDIETRIDEVKQEIDSGGDSSSDSGSSSGGGSDDSGSGDDSSSKDEYTTEAYTDPSGSEIEETNPPVSIPDVTVTVPTTTSTTTTSSTTTTTSTSSTTSTSTSTSTSSTTSTSTSTSTSTTTTTTSEVTTTTEATSTAATSTAVNGNVTGNDFDQGTLSVTFASGNSTATGTFTGEMTGLRDNLVVGDFSGTASGADTGTLKGVYRGVEGSLKGHIAAIFVDTDGDVGYLTGEQSGDMTGDSFSASGTLTREVVFTDNSADLNDLDDYNDFPIPVLGEIPFTSIKQTTINGEFNKEEYVVKYLPPDGPLPAKPVGFWGVTTTGGTYNSENDNPWTNKKYGQIGNTGDMYSTANLDYYMIGEVSGSKDGNIVTITGSDITYLDPLFKGKIDLWTYGIDDGENNYKSAGVGTYILTPLTFSIKDTSSGTSSDTDGLDGYKADTNGAQDIGPADMPFLMGATDSLFSGTPSITAAGSYPDYSNSPTIWNDDDLKSWDYGDQDEDETNDETYDNGKLIGAMGGVQYSDTLEGWFSGVYKDASGNAGTFHTNLAGTGCPTAGVFSMNGSFTRTQQMTDASTYTLGHEGIDGSLSGTNFSGINDGENYDDTYFMWKSGSGYIPTWGVIALELYGTYSGSSGSSWSAQMGG